MIGMVRLVCLALAIGVSVTASAATGQAAGRPVEPDVSSRRLQPTGSGAASTVKDHTSGWWNVRSSGVLCNGSTNDAAALAAAQTRAATDGVGLLIPCKIRIAGAAGTVSVPVRFEGGGSLDLQTGGSVTLAGALTAAHQRIFWANGGTLTFSAKVDALVPQWWGAVGDGLTDDTAAIQAAITAAGSTHDVYLPGGTYMVVNVELLNGTHIKGAGRALTTLKMRAGLTSSNYLTDRTGHAFNGFTVLYSSYPSGGYNGNLPLSGIEICDLTVDGNYTAQTLTESGWGVYLNSVTKTRIERVTVQNCLNHGITAKESTYGVFSNLDLLSNGHTTSGAGGDGLVLLGACYDNLVTDSNAIGNVSIGFEDEGRFGGSTSPGWRNKRNKWVNLLSQDSSDHNFLSLFTDGSSYTNCKSVNGGTNGINIVGTTDLVVDGLTMTNPGSYGVWIRPEVFGAYGRNYNLRARGVRVTDSGAYAVRVEDLQGGDLDLWVRGVTGGHAVSLITTASSDVSLRVNYDGTVPTAYAVGQAYAVGTIRSSGTRVYRLDVAFTGTGLSVTAPTGTTTSADNGGTWTYLYSANRAAYGVYAYNPTNLTLVDSVVVGCSDHNVWVDGTAGGASGFRAVNLKSLSSGGRTLNISGGVLTGTTNRVDASDLSGGSTALDLNTYAANLTTSNVVGYRSRNSGVTGAIASGATVSHGLSGTPAVVTLTAADGTPTAVYPSALGSSTFTVNYTGGGTHVFYWTAQLAGDP